jgi:hypothetical protein
MIETSLASCDMVRIANWLARGSQTVVEHARFAPIEESIHSPAGAGSEWMCESVRNCRRTRWYCNGTKFVQPAELPEKIQDAHSIVTTLRRARFSFHGVLKLSLTAYLK